MVFPLSIKWARVSDGHGWTANVLVVCLVFLADLCGVVISWKTTNVTIEALGLVSVEWQWYCEVSHRSHTGLTQVSHRSHTGVTQVSRRSHAGLTQVSRRSHAGLTQVSRRSHAGLTQVSRRSHTGLTQVSHRSHTGLTQVSHRSHTGIGCIPGEDQLYL